MRHSLTLSRVQRFYTVFIVFIALLTPLVSKADGIIKEINPLGSPSDVLSLDKTPSQQSGNASSSSQTIHNQTTTPDTDSKSGQANSVTSSKTRAATQTNATPQNANSKTIEKRNTKSSSVNSGSSKTRLLGASIKRSGRLNLEHVVFYYKTDEEVRYADKKTSYQSKARGQLPPGVAIELATEAYEESSVEQELPQWRYHGGPAPNIITAKAHLYNESSQARLNTHLNTVVKVKAGNMLVDLKTLLLDFNHLQKTAKWQLLAKQSSVVPALAAGEDSREDVMRFELIPFLNAHPNMWPIAIEITVKCPESGQTVTKQLSLIPDHFVVPTLY